MKHLIDNITETKRKMDEIGKAPVTDLVVTTEVEQALKEYMHAMGATRADAAGNTNPRFDGIELHVAHDEREAIEIMQRLHRENPGRWGIVTDGMLQVAANKINFFDMPDVDMKIYHRAGITP